MTPDLKELLEMVEETLTEANDLNHCDIWEMRHSCELRSVQKKCEAALTALQSYKASQGEGA